MTITLEELEVYQLSENISDLIWDICSLWEWFPKDTVGKQLVRAADSIGANIAEGYGRFSFKENIQFCYYARGSFYETKHWLRRAKQRKLLNANQEVELRKLFQKLGPKLNAYITSIKKEANKSSK